LGDGLPPSRAVEAVSVLDGPELGRQHDGQLVGHTLPHLDRQFHEWNNFLRLQVFRRPMRVVHAGTPSGGNSWMRSHYPTDYPISRPLSRRTPAKNGRLLIASSAHGCQNTVYQAVNRVTVPYERGAA
jgi:hypothetical protein